MDSPHKNPNDVYTQEDQAFLIELGDQLSSNKFEIGWLVAKTIDEHDTEEDDVTALDLYESAAKFVRASPRSIRYYTEIARHFPREVHDRLTLEYPSLSFSHFATARKRKYQEGELALEYLAFAGAGQYSPETGESLFDEYLLQRGENKPPLPAGKGSRGISEPDAKSYLYGIFRKQWGTANLPLKYARRAISIWRQARMLLRDIANERTEKKD